MLLKTVVPLDEKETGGSLFDKLSKAGADLLLKTLDALERHDYPQKQGESPTAYAKADQRYGSDRLEPPGERAGTSDPRTESVAECLYETKR